MVDQNTTTEENIERTTSDIMNERYCLDEFEEKSVVNVMKVREEGEKIRKVVQDD